MMQIRCQWCGWTYTMARETLLYAVAKAQADKAVHYSDNCPKCRRALKIQVSELKRRVPPGTQLPDVTVQPTAQPEAAAPQPATPAPEPVKEVVKVEKKKAPAAKKVVEANPPKKAVTKAKTAEKKTTKKK